MIQRYIDIGNLSFLSLLEIAGGAFFVYNVKNNRSITWVKTRIEVSIEKVKDLDDRYYSRSFG
jgi:hypothetical protein